MQTCLRFAILTTLIVSLICSTPLTARGQLVGPGKLFDGEIKGVLVGFGVGYAAAATGDSGASIGGYGVAGKLGYGVSDKLAFYLASTRTFGGMFFRDPNSPFYLHGSIGSGGHLSLSGGIGYELPHHTVLELGLGVFRYSDTAAAGYNLLTGETFYETSTVNIITIAATFNVHLY